MTINSNRHARAALAVLTIVVASVSAAHAQSTYRLTIRGLEQLLMVYGPTSRLGSFLYAHGEKFYNFQGLRAYKDKFHPAWESRYLAYPGGLMLPRTLADVAALIAGGYARILRK